MSAPTEEDDRDSKIDGDCHASVRYFIAMTGNSIVLQIPICRTVALLPQKICISLRIAASGPW